MFNCLKSQTKNANRWRAKHLVLDGITLQNLHVVPPVNSKKGAGIRDPTALKHSLYGTINKYVFSVLVSNSDCEMIGVWIRKFFWF